jgi:flagellar protein FliO/FliZ
VWRYLMTLIAMMPLSSFATAKTIPSSSSYLSVIASLFIVIAAMLVMAIFYKRMNLGFANSQGIKIVTALSVGTKERVLVIEVNGQQHLLGVTSQQINHLLTLDEPIEAANANVTMKSVGLSFQKILQGAKKRHD